MVAVNVSEMRAVEAGLKTTCPICGKSVTVGVLQVLFYGKKSAIADARYKAQAMHYNFSTGYKKNVTHR
jgi:hypothetical protein